jgi:protein-tyrosine-phosphatase
LTKELIEDCDFIFVMAQIHRQQIIALCPEAADKCFLLAEDTEIPDPIGQSQHVYYGCAEMIEKAVKKRISELII